MKSLDDRDKEKIFDSEEFFNPINVRNDDLLKKKIISNQLEIVLKSSKKKDGLIKNLTASDIIRRIKYLKFTENIKNRI